MMALSAQAVMRASQACRAGRAGVEVVQQTGSTNADLLARAGRLSGPLLLACEAQTAGRGRAGRSWLSAPGASLTFSLAWKFDLPAQGLAGLPLAVGVTLAEVLGALGVKVQLKWPNDLLKDGSKLAGILIETQGAAGGTWAIIGIGLNLALPDELEAAIGRPVASATWLAQMDRNVLLARLLDGLAGMADEFTARGFAPFTARWNRLHGWQGHIVRVVDGATVLHEGVAAGVDELGQLLLDTDGGRVRVVAGDVSLREKG